MFTTDRETTVSGGLESGVGGVRHYDAGSLEIDVDAAFLPLVSAQLTVELPTNIRGRM
jgi:hypothetical protein